MRTSYSLAPFQMLKSCNKTLLLLRLSLISLLLLLLLMLSLLLLLLLLLLLMLSLLLLRLLMLEPQNCEASRSKYVPPALSTTTFSLSACKIWWEKKSFSNNKFCEKILWDQDIRDIKTVFYLEKKKLNHLLSKFCSNGELEVKPPIPGDEGPALEPDEVNLHAEDSLQVLQDQEVQHNGTPRQQWGQPPSERLLVKEWIILNQVRENSSCCRILF